MRVNQRIVLTVETDGRIFRRVREQPLLTTPLKPKAGLNGAPAAS
jgi:hypothetical protein